MLVLTPGHLPLFPPLLSMFSRSELAQRPGHAETCHPGLGKVGEALFWAPGAGATASLDMAGVEKVATRARQLQKAH